jgi:hypothetical protein
MKSIIKVYKDSAEIEGQYNVLLSVIRDLEFMHAQEAVTEKIAILDDVLDLLGTMMLAAAKDIEAE